MTCTGVIGHTLRSCLLGCGIGVWLGTSSVVAPMSCTSQPVFCCKLRNLAFTGKTLTPPMDHGSMSRLMFGLTKATRSPGRGDKDTPKWGIKPPPTPSSAFFDPWGGFMPPGGGFIPPFCRGGFIPPFGHLGRFYHPFGVVLSPIFGDFIPLLGGWGGLAHLNVNQETQSRKTDRRTVHSLDCFGLDCFALLCCVVLSPPPPPPVPRNGFVQEPPPGSAVEFSHNFLYQWACDFPWFWWM